MKLGPFVIRAKSRIQGPGRFPGFRWFCGFAGVQMDVRRSKDVEDARRFVSTSTGEALARDAERQLTARGYEHERVFQCRCDDCGVIYWTSISRALNDDLEVVELEDLHLCPHGVICGNLDGKRNCGTCSAAAAER